MRIEVPPELPRRELDGPPRLYRAFGLLWLEVVVLRVAGVRKRTGEVRYRRLLTRYRVVQDAPGVVVLVTDRPDPNLPLEPLKYRVTEYGCSCPDFGFKARERWCKHRTSLEAVGLLSGPVAEVGAE